MEADVFISFSYAHDPDLACSIEAQLTADVYTNWLDSSRLPMGQAFVSNIAKALESCKVYLLVDSTHSRQSYWVRRELETAIRLRDPLVFQGASFSKLRRTCIRWISCPTWRFPQTAN